MRWRAGRRSSNIEDRRGMRVSRKAAGGGIGTIVLVLVALYFGVDPGVVMQNTGSLPAPSQRVDVPLSAEEQELGDFVSVVLADTEDTWQAIFRQAGAQYREPTLVLFTGAVESACGFAQAATGPFYCPADQKVYIDPSFYRDLRERFHAPGDFAQAYVIAHEIGHHVQTLLGISGKGHDAQRRLSSREANDLSVRLELQADCFAGIWANHADRSHQLLESGDIEEGLTAANAIDDDRLQQQVRGRVVPDSFTHGNSAQRVRWFKFSLADGAVGACNTFEAAAL
ncbi:KPN_02809 family neutral zinc metallopeptidase [Trichloromonas sp.]|uniref:KPN_02809 family neutral zinc metallopeptidase n=1 Tax=Trichloromonas sp. TaxID=3069249 RepID=UPI003D813FE1